MEDTSLELIIYANSLGGPSTATCNPVSGAFPASSHWSCMLFSNVASASRPPAACNTMLPRTLCDWHGSRQRCPAVQQPHHPVDNTVQMLYGVAYTCLWWLPVVHAPRPGPQIRARAEYIITLFKPDSGWTLPSFQDTMPGQQEAAQELMLGVLSMGTAPEERGRHVPIQGPPRPLRHSSRSPAGSGAGRPHMGLAEVTVPIRSCLDIAQWERPWQ